MHSPGREKQVQELSLLLSPVPPRVSAPVPLASPQWPHPRRSCSQECWLTAFSHVLLRDGSPLGLAAVFVPAVSSTCPPQGLQCAWGPRALLREGSFQGKECMYLGWASMAGSQRWLLLLQSKHVSLLARSRSSRALGEQPKKGAIRTTGTWSLSSAGWK